MDDCAADDALVLKPDDDGRLFVIRALTSGEERVARYCYRALNGRELRFPMFYDPERPGDYTRWVHAEGVPSRCAAWRCYQEKGPGELSAAPFRLAVNLKTAAAVGLEVPQEILAQADSAIE